MKKQMVSFTEPQHRRIQSEAGRLGISFAELVRRVLDRRIKRYRGASLDHDGEKIVFTVRRSESEEFEVEIPFETWDKFELEWLKGKDVYVRFFPPDIYVNCEANISNAEPLRSESLKSLISDFCESPSGNQEEAEQLLIETEALLSECLDIARASLKRITDD